MQSEYASDVYPSIETYQDAARDLEVQSRLEMRKLSDLAWVFLLAANGDRQTAVELMDRSIDLLCEGGVLQTWRYRALLQNIGEGL